MKRETFQGCINQNKLIEIGEHDENMARELLKLAEHRELFWKEVKEKAKTYPTLFLEGHYEIIKELSTAILALEGWKATNHECLLLYLQEKRKDLEIDFNYLLELKDTRNSIDYRGVVLGSDVWTKNALKIQVTIQTFKDDIKKKLAEKEKNAAVHANPTTLLCFASISLIDKCTK